MVSNYLYVRLCIYRQPIGHLRRIFKAMERYMPDAASIHEEKELVPGGDLRIKGNWWLRRAWRKSKATRVPREMEFRKILRTLIQRHSLCNLVYFLLLNTTGNPWYYTCRLLFSAQAPKVKLTLSPGSGNKTPGFISLQMKYLLKFITFW